MASEGQVDWTPEDALRKIVERSQQLKKLVEELQAERADLRNAYQQSVALVHKLRQESQAVTRGRLEVAEQLSGLRVDNARLIVRTNALREEVEKLRAQAGKDPGTVPAPERCEWCGDEKQDGEHGMRLKSGVQVFYCVVREHVLINKQQDRLVIVANDRIVIVANPRVATLDCNTPDELVRKAQAGNWGGQPARGSDCASESLGGGILPTLR